MALVWHAGLGDGCELQYMIVTRLGSQSRCRRMARRHLPGLHGVSLCGVEVSLRNLVLIGLLKIGRWGFGRTDPLWWSRGYICRKLRKGPKKEKQQTRHEE